MIHSLRQLVVIGFAIGFLSGPGPALADADVAVGQIAFDGKAALANSQAAIGRKLRDHRFVSADGKPVRIADFSGKPLIISLIYSSCYHTCPQITQSLARAVEVANDALGSQKFEVVTIGFDTEFDKPSAMRSFARKQGIDFANWRFLSTDATTVWRLSDDIGFQFTPSPRGFDHLTQTTIVDRDGHVYAQVYGDDFATPQLVDPLKNLVFSGGPWNSLNAILDRVRLVCTTYDPARDAYYFDYSLFIGMAIGIVCLLVIVIFIYREFVQNRRIPPVQS